MRNASRALALVAIVTPGLASTSDARAGGRAETHIVQLRGHPVVAYGGEVGLAPTRPAPGRKIDPASPAVRAYVRHLESVHDRIVAAIGAEKVCSYRYTFNGFAARMTAAQARALRQMGDVVQVWKDELLQPQTDTTPRLLGLSGSRGVWHRERLLGEDIVVGIIDTGIWPEHPSFADTGCGAGTRKEREAGWRWRCDRPYRYDPRARPKDLDREQWRAALYGPPPETFNSSGCQFGNTAFNPMDAPFACDDKLLAARYYAGGFSTPGTTRPDGSGGDGAFLVPEEYLSARDQDGHGSHTGSTAAGNLHVPAEIEGEDRGRVSGMAPRARIAAYKVCWNGSFPPPGFIGGCFSSDSLAAIDQAVADGVDVINFSIGGPGTGFNGPDDIAFLFAVEAGVFVATSGGNRGPGAETIATPAGVPWVTAVGASQDDTVFGTGFEVTAPARVSDIYEGLEGFGPVALEDTGAVSGDLVVADPENGCGLIDPTGDPTLANAAGLDNAAGVSGQLAHVIRGGCSFLEKYLNAQVSGATAIIVSNDGTAPDRVDPIIMGGLGGEVAIAGMMIGFEDGDLLAATPGVAATLDPAIVVSKEDTIAGFSSRGPNGGAPDVIKPDVVAPGVDILAAQTPTPNDGQTPGQLFQIISGTSMAGPHVAGVAALIRQEHPDWTPAMVRSALMTSSRQDIDETFGHRRADPFDIGAGHIRPRALDPGIVYDAGLFDYVAFTCGAGEQLSISTAASCAFVESRGFPTDPSDLNLPSIAVAGLTGTQTVTRTVTSVAQGRVSWRARVEAPPAIEVRVDPEVMTLEEGELATYTVTFSVTDDAVFDEWAFGSLTWVGRRGGHRHGAWCGPGGDHRIRALSPIAIRPVRFEAPDAVSGLGARGALDFEVGFGDQASYTAGAHGLDEAETRAGVVGDDPFNDVNTALGTCDFGQPFPWPCTGLAWHLVFRDASRDALVRVSLFDDDTDGHDDLDLYVWDASFNFVGGSGNVDSDEQVDIPFPADTLYVVAVHAFEADGPDARYTLSSWDLGLVDDRGHMRVTAPGSATFGRDTVRVDWTGLDAGSRYLGAVSHRDDAGLLGLTLVEIDTR